MGLLVKKHWLIFTILVISLGFSLAGVLPVFLTLFGTPAGQVNMLVGHFFLDYYQYLSFIKQGEQGKILLTNLMTSDDWGKFLLPWWPYSLFGWLLGSIGLPTQFIYWLAQAMLTFAYLLISFWAVSILLAGEKALIKLAAFLLAVFASSFYRINWTDGLVIAPFGYWYSIGLPSYRYGLPHHLAAQLLFLLAVLLMIRYLKSSLVFPYAGLWLIFSLLLLFSSPPLLLLLWLVMLLVLALSQPKFPKTLWFKAVVGKGLPLLVVLALLVPLFFLVMRTTYSSPTHQAARAFEKDTHVYPSLWLLGLTTGPLLILGLAGLPFYWLQKSLARLAFFLVGLLSLFFLLVPMAISGQNILSLLGVSNLRFQTPALYLPLAASAILFLKNIFKKNLTFLASLFALLLFSLPPTLTAWQQGLKKTYEAGPFQFLASDLYLGLKKLEYLPMDTVVLTSFGSGFGLLIPAIAGRRVYLSRPFATLAFEEKFEQADRFYSLKMTSQEALAFIKKEGISAVTLTSAEDNSLLLEHYPFLQPKFRNSQLSIFMIYPSYSSLQLLKLQ